MTEEIVPTLETTRAAEIQQWLETLKRAGSKSGEFLLKYGKAYPTTAHSWDGERGQEKMCYRNAYHLATSDPRVTYVEGYVHIGILPIEHAWCVRDGNVIDPTLTAENGEAYFGVPFNTTYLRTTALKTGYYGVISGTNRPLLLGEVPPAKFLEV
jgi:hypothetical protein